MVKAFFQAIFILAALGIASGLGFFGGVHIAPFVKQGLVDLSDMPPDLIEQHRSKAFRKSEVKQWEQITGMTGSRTELGQKTLPEGVPAFPHALLANTSAEIGWVEFDAVGDDGALAAAKDGWTVVNLWASWCAPCIEEMPDMQVAAPLLAERGVTLLSINADPMNKDTLASVEQIYTTQGITAFPPVTALGPAIDTVLASAGMSRAQYQYPTKIIYAPGGKPFAIFQDLTMDTEKAWSSPEMLDFFEALAQSGS